MITGRLTMLSWSVNLKISSLILERLSKERDVEYSEELGFSVRILLFCDFAVKKDQEKVYV